MHPHALAAHVDYREVPQLRQVARNGGLRLPQHGDQFTDTKLWPALGQEMDYAQAGAIGQRAQ